MGYGSKIRLRQLNQEELSGYAVQIIDAILSDSGTYLAATGHLTGAFYPLRQNPNGYATSGDFVSSQDLASAITQLSIYISENYAPIGGGGGGTGSFDSSNAVLLTGNQNISGTKVFLDSGVFTTLLNGLNNTAAGLWSHAEGSSSAANGNYSHAEGQQAIANGNYSHAAGSFTIANGVAQSVIGKYNTADTDSLFIIGNGADNSNRNNVLTVKTNSFDINAPLTVENSGYFSSGLTANGPLMVLGEFQPANIVTQDESPHIVDTATVGPLVIDSNYTGQTLTSLTIDNSVSNSPTTIYVNIGGSVYYVGPNEILDIVNQVFTYPSESANLTLDWTPTFDSYFNLNKFTVSYTPPTEPFTAFTVSKSGVVDGTNLSVNGVPVYLSSNPSGFITASQTGAFVTSGQTGAFYPANNPLNFVSAQNVVSLTGNQTISGQKTFVNDTQINGWLKVNNVYDTLGQQCIDNAGLALYVGGAPSLGWGTRQLFGSWYSNDFTILGTGFTINGQRPVLANQTGGFVTTGETGAFYAASNPNGYITSTYASATFYPKFGNPSNFITSLQTGNFVTKSQTGAFAADAGVVKLTSNQEISGIKTFRNQVSFIHTFNEFVSFSGRLNSWDFPYEMDPIFRGDCNLQASFVWDTGTSDPGASIYFGFGGYETTIPYGTGLYLDVNFDLVEGFFITDYGTEAYGDFVYTLTNNVPTGYETGIILVGNTVSGEIIKGSDGVFNRSLTISGKTVATEELVIDASGYLVSLISAASAGVSSINSQSGIISLVGAGNVSVTTVGSTITVSGTTGLYVTTGQTGAFVTTGQTGNFVTTGQTGSFVTTGQTGNFYPRSNPSGYITGVDLSAYITTGQTGSFVTTSQTGDFVDKVSDQTIAGQKTFTDNAYFHAAIMPYSDTLVIKRTQEAAAGAIALEFQDYDGTKIGGFIPDRHNLGLSIQCSTENPVVNILDIYNGPAALSVSKILAPIAFNGTGFHQLADVTDYDQGQSSTDLTSNGPGSLSYDASLGAGTYHVSFSYSVDAGNYPYTVNLVLGGSGYECSQNQTITVDEDLYLSDGAINFTWTPYDDTAYNVNIDHITISHTPTARNQALAIDSDGNSVFAIDGGNVSIGTGVSSYKLQVNGSTNIIGDSQLDGDLNVTGAFSASSIQQGGVNVVLANQTGNFVTQSQTGVFYPRTNPSGYITTGQTGVFVTTGQTGSFITTGQTGVFYPRTNPSGYVTTGQTGVFVTTSQTGQFYPTSNPSAYISSASLSGLTDVTLTTPLVDESLVYNGTKWINKNLTTISAGPGVVFYLDNAPSTGGNSSLLYSPTGGTEQTDVGVANNGLTNVIERYISPPLGGTTIEGGSWDFSTYASVNSLVGDSTIVHRINKRVEHTGIVAVSGAGLSRACTVTNEAPFVPADASTDITLATLLETPNATFWITGYTSATQVSLRATNVSDPNQTGSFAMYNYLFKATSPIINSTSVALYETNSVQPAFTGLNTGDRLVSAYFGQTTAVTNITFTIYHNGTEHFSHFHTPLVTRHNDLAGLQGGQSGQYYHLNQSEYVNLATGAVVRPNQTGLFVTTGQTGIFVTTGQTGNFVDIISDQVIGGNKNFSNPIAISAGGDVPTHYYSVLRAELGNGYNIPGAIKITLPKRSSNTMLQVSIRGFDYSPAGDWEMRCGGYNFSDGNWYRVNAEIIGKAPFNRVRFGHDGTNDIILLGLTGVTLWNYPRLDVSEVITNYSNRGDWGTGWSAALITDEAPLTITNEAVIDKYTSTDGYFGIGTVAPEHPLDVNGSAIFSEAIYLRSPSTAAAFINTLNDWMNFSSFWGVTFSDNFGTTFETYSGRMGVGRTPEFQKLEVAGNIAIANGYPSKLYMGSVGDGYEVLTASGALLRVNQNANYEKLSLEGKVGIGTINPTEKLDVSGNIKCNSITSSAPFTVLEEYQPADVVTQDVSPGTVSTDVAGPLVIDTNYTGGATVILRVDNSVSNFPTSLDINIGGSVNSVGPNDTLEISGFYTFIEGYTNVTFSWLENPDSYFNLQELKVIQTPSKVSWTGLYVSSGESSSVTINGADKGTTNLYAGANLNIYTTDALDADKGGSINLGGVVSSTNDIYGFAAIKGAKEAAGDGENNGYLAFYNSQAGIGSVETARLTSEGRLGIGTPAPLTKLHVNDGTYNDKADVITWGRDDDAVRGVMGQDCTTNAAVYIGAKTNHDLNIITNDTTRVTVDSLGNVGIGIASSGVKLHVNAAGPTGVSTEAFRLNYANYYSSAGHISMSVGDSVTETQRITYGLTTDIDNGYLAFSTFNAYRSPQLKEAMRIKGNGYVGIGTSEPAQQLEIAGNLRCDILGGGNYFWETFGVISDPGAYPASVWGVRTRQYNVGAGAWVYPLVWNAHGYVGIGTTGSQSRLQLGDYQGSEALTLASYNNTESRINFYDQNDTEGASIRVSGKANGAVMNFANRWNADSNKVTFDLVNGYVGINQPNPSSALWVGGDVVVQPHDTNGGILFAGSGATRLYSDSTAGLWCINADASPSRGNIILADGYSWDRSCELRYTPYVTDESNGTLTIGQIQRNSTGAWTHGYTEFYNSGQLSVRIMKDGDVGIGTAYPSSRLSLATPAGTSALSMQAGTGGNWEVGPNAGGGTNDDTFSFYSATYGPSNSYVPIMTLTNGGKVSVGHAAPTAGLDVYGVSVGPDLLAHSAASARFQADVGTQLAIHHKPAPPYTVSLQVKHAMVAYQNNAYPLALNPSGGYVGVAMSTPTWPLDLLSDESNGGKAQRWGYANESANSSYKLSLDTSVTSADVRWAFNQTNANNVHNNALVFHQGAVGIGCTDAPPGVGNLQVAGTIYPASDTLIFRRAQESSAGAIALAFQDYNGDVIGGFVPDRNNMGLSIQCSPDNPIVNIVDTSNNYATLALSSIRGPFTFNTIYQPPDLTYLLGGELTPITADLTSFGSGSLSYNTSLPTGTCNVDFSYSVDAGDYPYTVNLNIGGNVYYCSGGQTIAVSETMDLDSDSIEFTWTTYDDTAYNVNIDHISISQTPALVPTQPFELETNGNCSFAKDGSTYGNISIGGASLGQRLTIIDSGDYNAFNGIVSVLANNQTIGVGMGYGGFSMIGSNTDVNMYLNAKGAGFTSINAQDGGNVGIGLIDPAYKLQVNGDTNIIGDISASTKSFLIDHPTKQGLTLRHGALEGPEYSVYIRGQASGNFIPFPDYWSGLVDMSTITATFTPIKQFNNLALGDITVSGLYVESEKANPFYNFHIFAERKDIPKMIVEANKY